MIRVGLVGEDPNDTSSIRSLLFKKYKSKVIFVPLIKRIKGYALDNNPKVRRALPIEFKDKNCHFVLYVRDLDGFKTEFRKLNNRQKWFKDLDLYVNNKGIFLLNIWELEALIFADIKTFNKIYNINYKYNGDPMVQKEPKEELKRITSQSNKKYKESHCPDIFEKLDFDTIYQNCSYFKHFIKEFNDKIL